MPGRINDSVRRNVVWEWILGGSNEVVAQKNNISVGTVRNISAELKQGRYPEYTDYVSYLNDLRRLSIQLTSRGRTLSQALAGTLLLDELLTLGVDVPELQQVLRVLRRVSPPGFPREAFVKAALRVVELEQETGQDFGELEKNAVALKGEVEDLERTKAELMETIDSLQSRTQVAQQYLDQAIKRRVEEIQQLEQAKASALAKNKLTEEKLVKYLQVQSKLASYGIDFERLEALVKVLEEFDRHEMEPGRIFRYVTEINGLSEQVDLWTRSFEKVQEDVGSGKESLDEINNEITKARLELDDLQNRKTGLTAELDLIKKKHSSYALPIDLAQTLLHLLDDPSKATDQQLLYVSKTLEGIVKTRSITKEDLIVDYGRLKQMMILLVETVLGKTLVIKQTRDRELTTLRNRNTELQLNILGKLRRQKDEVARERTDLDREKLALWEATEDRVLKVAIAQVKEGHIFMGRCKKCRAKGAILLGSEKPSFSFRCPCCWSNLEPIRNPIPAPLVPLYEKDTPTTSITT